MNHPRPTIFRNLKTAFCAALGWGALVPTAPAQEKLPWDFLPPPFDRYLEQRVAEASSAAWMDGITAENWPEKREEMRGQLRKMLGLDPWPERTPLNPVIVGRVEGDGYVVEKLRFEPLPGLHVAANLYLPKGTDGPLPTILYMAGHSPMRDGDVRFGNKTGYQHHGAWFARHGYVCLIPDTLDHGEIPGYHHGTYRLGRWWWASRGYTPAGVEAWTGIRALDYLESRPEVDGGRIGMTGRSGGGAYTWWVGGLDDRIKVAVPVAGITNLEDHVVEGVIEGHCDCMFMVNSERWDFDRVAALMAPRPLLISNTDRDDIFPLSGVIEIYNRTRGLYRKLGKESLIGLHIAEGPHKDTQQLNYGAFNWMNRFLKDGDIADLIDEPARKLHEPRELKVFEEVPEGEKVSTVDEFFVPAFEAPSAPADAGRWAETRDRWMGALREEVFAAWPADGKPEVGNRSERVRDGYRLLKLELQTQEEIALPLWIVRREGPGEGGAVTLKVLDDEGWERIGPWLDREAGGAAAPDELVERGAVAFFWPRGTGPTGMSHLTEAKRNHIRRRLLLLGESLESGQVWDIKQAAEALRALADSGSRNLSIEGEGTMAANIIYASLFIDGLDRLMLGNPPASHRDGPTYLNVRRHMDLPQALAMAAERVPVTLAGDEPAAWDDATEVVAAMGWGDRLRVVSGE